MGFYSVSSCNKDLIFFEGNQVLHFAVSRNFRDVSNLSQNLNVFFFQIGQSHFDWLRNDWCQNVNFNFGLNELLLFEDADLVVHGVDDDSDLLGSLLFALVENVIFVVDSENLFDC